MHKAKINIIHVYNASKRDELVDGKRGEGRGASVNRVYDKKFEINTSRFYVFLRFLFCSFSFFQ